MTASGDLRAVKVDMHPVRMWPYRLLVLALLAALASVVAVLIRAEGGPPIKLLLLFGALVVIAENRDRIFGDETSISGSIAVALASVVAFRHSTPLLGPLVCASVAGIYWPHVRERSFDKIVVNAASIGFSALAAAAVVDVMGVGRSNSVVDVFVLAIPAVAVYWIVNTCVLAFAISLLRGADFGRNALLLVGSETSMLGFALVGAVTGLMFLKHGYWFGAAVLTSMLVFLDLFVIAPRSWLTSRIHLADVARRYTQLGPLVCASVFAAFGTEQIGALLGASAAVVGALVVTFLVALLGVRRRVGLWELHLALGVAIVDAPLVIVFAIAGVLAVTVSVWLALAVAAVALLASVALARWRHRNLVRHQQEDERLAAAIELAVIDSRDWSSSSR